MADDGRTLGGSVIRDALTLLGKQLGVGEELEITIVGGAAGVLSGQLPAQWTTADVDVVRVRPSQVTDEVLGAAVVVGDMMGISAGWMNCDAGLFLNALPDAWVSRRIGAGAFGRLQVYVLGRQDLIVAKFFAHRDVDFEHLAELRVTKEELEYTRVHLKRLSEWLVDDRNRIEMALYLMADWDDSV